MSDSTYNERYYKFKLFSHKSMNYDFKLRRDSSVRGIA